MVLPRPARNKHRKSWKHRAVFAGKENEQGMTVAQWPGVNSTEFPGHKEAHYSEGQIVGYRWYDKHGVTPAYPFGRQRNNGTVQNTARYDAIR
jgi:hypothetical protein